MPTKHFPYKYCPRTGKGPKGRSTRHANKWACLCAKKKHRPGVHGGLWSKCVCKSVRHERADKIVWVNLLRHRKYGALYKEWVKQNRRRVCPRPGHSVSRKWFPRQGAGLMRPNVRPVISWRIKKIVRRHHA